MKTPPRNLPHTLLAASLTLSCLPSLLAEPPPSEANKVPLFLQGGPTKPVFQPEPALFATGGDCPLLESSHIRLSYQIERPAAPAAAENHPATSHQ